jgi:hypothetical protein
MRPVLQNLLIDNTVSRERLSGHVCDTYNRTGRILKGTGMQVSKQLLAVFIFILTAFGCDNGGSRSAASRACVDFCDGTSEKCDTFDLQNCEIACDELDRLDDDLSRGCDDAIVDLFDCLDNETCDDLNENFTEPIENLENFFEQLDGLCPVEDDEVKAKCGPDFEISSTSAALNVWIARSGAASDPDLFGFTDSICTTDG